MNITHNPSGEVYELDPHQYISLAHLYANPRAGLFLEMSLSKTIITLLYLYDMTYREAAIVKTLVIAPDKVARLTWPEQINTWQEVDDFRYSVIEGTAKQRLEALNTDADIYTIGVDNLDWLLSQYIYRPTSKSGATKYPWTGSLPFDCIVFDESTLFKNWGSNRFKAIRRALDLSDVPYRIALTGTPAANGEKDIWAQVNLVDDGERLGAKIGEYLDKYFNLRGNGMVIFEYNTKPGAASQIADKISDIVLSLNAVDVDIELPDIITKDVILKLYGLERETYDELENEYFLDFLEGTSATVKTSVDLTNKLLQVAAGAIYEDKVEGAARVWHELNNVKLDAMAQIFERHAGENFIIVYQFRHELERILSRFPDAVALPKGKKLRDVFAAWNAGEISKLVIHPASAGHGLNLQFGGHNILLASPFYNLEYLQQIIARLRRRGGAAFVNVWRLLISGTVDMRVKRKVENKESDQDFFMNEIKYFKTKNYVR